MENTLEKLIVESVPKGFLNHYDITIENHPKSLTDYKFIVSEKKSGREIVESTYYNDSEINSSPTYLKELMDILIRGIGIRKNNSEVRKFGKNNV